MWLTDKQLERLTRRKRPQAQAQVLREAGIPFDMVDGRPIVAKNWQAEKPRGRLVLA
jgi:hypothetical protein